MGSLSYYDKEIDLTNKQDSPIFKRQALNICQILILILVLILNLPLYLPECEAPIRCSQVCVSRLCSEIGVGTLKLIGGIDVHVRSCRTK